MADEKTVVIEPQAPAAPAPAPSPAPAARGKKAPSKNKKKWITRVIALIVAAAILIGGGTVLYRFLTASDDTLGEIYSGTANIGSIQSTASGSGNAKAKESAAITLSAGGTVQEVFVTSGDVVSAGQPLYTIHSQAALDAVTSAREAYQTQLDGLQDLYEEQNNLVLRAPHSGKLMEVEELKPGDNLGSNTRVAKLVNDTKLKLSLYYSYAYEGQISVGQKVQVSIPAVMDTLEGTVEKINMVRYIVPEGSICFEVVIVIDNPGTLTEGMSVSASMAAPGGGEIFPYENGELKYYETTDLYTKAAGPVLSSVLLNYADVSQGQALVTLGDTEVAKRISEKMESVRAAEDKLLEAQKALEDFSAVAPIDGTITSCTLSEGAEVKGGDTVIIISNTTTMLVTITVDDRNISFIHPGDMVELTWNNTPFMGTVTAIDMGNAQAGQGMTNYPVTLSVDNFTGELMDGAWLQYSFVTSQSDDCILVPAASVKYFTDTEGNRKSVVFVQRDSRPDDVPELDLPTFEPGQKRTYPSEEEGYYPVIVETGLSDPQNCEILSGIEVGDTVFISYTVVDSSYA